MIGMYGPLKVYSAQSDKLGKMQTVYARACNLMEAIRTFDRFYFPPLDEPVELAPDSQEYKFIAPYVEELCLVVVHSDGEVWRHKRKPDELAAEPFGTQANPGEPVQCLEKGPGVEMMRQVRREVKRRRTVVGRARIMASLLGENYDSMNREQKHRWEFVAYAYGVRRKQSAIIDPIVLAVQLSRVENQEALSDAGNANRLFLNLPNERQMQYLDAATKLKEHIG